MNVTNELNKYCAESMISHLGILFTEVGKKAIKASMPVSTRTTQPGGILHGGASLALAETLAGAGSYLIVDREKFNVLGIQVSANHVATAKQGILTGEAHLIHEGNTTHVWEVKITDENNKLISTVRVTNMITGKKKEE